MDFNTFFDEIICLLFRLKSHNSHKTIDNNRLRIMNCKLQIIRF